MKEIKKFLCSIVTFTILTLCIVVTPIKAENEIIDMNDTWITVNLVSVSIPTTYKKSEYKVFYTTNANKYTARIVEIKSGKEVAKYNETIEGKNVREVQLLKNSDLLGSTSYDSIIDGTFSLLSNSNDFKACIWLWLYVNSGTYWRQCDQLRSYTYSSYDNEMYTLDENHIFDGTSSYPATKVKIDINGIINTSSSSIKELGLSYLDLKKLGFNMTGSYTYWHASKSYNTSITLMLMK